MPDLTASSPATAPEPGPTTAVPAATSVAPARPDRATRRRIGAEIWIVLGLSLGKSAVYAIINIVARLTADTPLRDQSASLNVSRSARPYLDLTYQLVGIFFAVLPVALALYLLSARGRSAVRAIGLDGSRPLKDVGWGRVKFVVWSSLLRGSYHLYQGFGPFLGNVVMGVVFSWFYTSRWGRHRVMPLVIAHTLLDVVAFVGYALLPLEWKQSLGLA